MVPDTIKKKKLPTSSGVYFFLGKKTKAKNICALKGRRVLYVGKSGSIKDRIRSYFSKDVVSTRGPAIEKMVEEAEEIAFEKTDSVLEAIIAESYFIKYYFPKYNVRDKDDKSFNYVVITDEKFPRVLLVRGKELLKNKTSSSVNLKSKNFKIKSSFGPFPQGGVLKNALRIIRKIIPFRDTCTACESEKSCKPCFNRQIGLCPGVCSGEISKTEYKLNIRNVGLLFQGKKKELINRLKKDMKKVAEEKKFELAAGIRNQIFSLEHIKDVSLLRVSNNSSYGSSKRIEGYDIAHLGGSEVVGVMTVLEGGEAEKGEYRKFNIRDNNTGGDIPSLRELLSRRLKHTEWEYPSLIVVDGGKAQVNCAKKVLSEYNLKIPVVGVVKDERHRPKRIEWERVHVRKYEKEILFANSEAHRFALAFHKKRLRKRV
jgi:excinuclease ABC subunit C